MTVTVPEASFGSRPPRTVKVLALASELIRIPSVTNCAEERVDEVRRCAGLLADRLGNAGLEVRRFDDGDYPALLAEFPGAPPARVTLGGHFDVVQPEPDDRQFEPRIEGDWLWGRGAADMKTVVASYVVWLGELRRAGPPYPHMNLLLVGNEENGEQHPWGTPHVLACLAAERRWQPELMILGERTGEAGSELFTDICTANRGVLRMRVEASGERGHSGTGAVPADLVDRLIAAREELGTLFRERLTLTSVDGWETTARFPFLVAGEPGVYNITAGGGVLGVEVRSIPGDRLGPLVDAASAACAALGLQTVVEVCEDGIACPSDNHCLVALLEAAGEVAGRPARVGRKKPGTSARFAPGGNAVVWGQSGVGPHSAAERHFIPSIEPYLATLDALARRLGAPQVR
jgi:acetylornithine deacetylase/succinyl-diaminopimelate desuccinylase-like protein